MAKEVTICLVFILSNLLTISFVFGEINGLTIKLIHRDSPESPFYQPNRTNAQKMERLINQSEARLENYYDFPSDLQSKIVLEGAFIFLAQIGLGSFPSTNEPFKSYYFGVDVGSVLTWLECQDCKLAGNHCFRPNKNLFLIVHLLHIKNLCHPARGPRHPLCNPRECIGDFCSYKVNYNDNSTSKGFLSLETFTFDTTNGKQRKERVPNVVFGCGFDTRNLVYPDVSKISGILGLGWGARSLVQQLGTKSNGKFSYCLQRMSQQATTTSLHFGDNIPRTRAIYSTPLLQYSNKSSYFVNLTGLSVSCRRLNISANDFARKSNNTGGCVMDSGSAVSNVVNFAYVQMKEKLVEYFGYVHGFVKVQVPRYDLCYQRTGGSKGFKNLPTMTFHFQGANLELEPPHVFFLNQIGGKETFCLAMRPNNGANHLTIIGAYQQTNYRFNYLTHQKMLQFGPENCSANA